MNSIQRKLSIGLASIVIIVGIVVAQTSLWLFDQGLRRYLETHLRLETETLLSALVRGKNGIELRQQRISSAYDRPFSGHYFTIHLQEQNWRSRSAWDHPITAPVSTGLQARLADGPAGQELLLYRSDFRRFGQNISITVANDYRPMLEIFRNMAWIVAGLGASALVVLLVMQRILVANALKPLETVREQIAQLQQGQRSQLDTGVPVELLPLVQQINHLLQHTENSLKRSRHALGTLGHALKTPLSVLLGLSNRDELQQYPELNNTMKKHLDQIQLRINRELGRARLAGEALPGAYFDCAGEIPDLLATLAKIHQRQLAIEWKHPSSLRLPWDREDILEMLGNVLDNACKWATSRVELDIINTGGQFIISVDDDGPGISGKQHNAMLARGKRADEHIDGHGLGLAIVRDIVENCQGEISLASSALGGLRVNISLPARS